MISFFSQQYSADGDPHFRRFECSCGNNCQGGCTSCTACTGTCSDGSCSGGCGDAACTGLCQGTCANTCQNSCTGTAQATIVKYDNITHRYNKGTYTLYFSSDFKLLNEADANPSAFSQLSTFNSTFPNEGFTHMDWTNIEIKSIGGKKIIDMDFVPTVCFAPDFTLEEGLQTIGAYTFQGCTILTSLTLPKSLTSIGDFAFSGCTGLKTLNIPLNGNLLSIGTEAFKDCPIENLILPNKVFFKLGAKAFDGTKNVKILKTDPTRATSQLFGNTLQSVYVPYSEDHSILNAYKTADGWSDYANIIYESDPE